MLRKYEEAHLSRQIQILIILFTFIPIIALLSALGWYNSEQMIGQVTDSAIENMEEKSEHLSNYMRSYMEPFYSALIDERIWELIRDLPKDVKRESSQIFSVLESYCTPSNNEVALMFLMRTDGEGYLFIRRPSSLQIVVTSNNQEHYQGFIDLARESLNKDRLVTQLHEYREKSAISVSHRIYNYKTKECYGSLVMLMYSQNVWSILDSTRESYTAYLLKTDEHNLFSTIDVESFSDSNSAYMNTEKVRWTGWQLASLVDTKKIREKAGLSTLAVSAAICMSICCLLMLMTVFVKRRMKMLNLLENAMENIHSKGEYTPLPENNIGELGSLFHGYNRMVHKIFEQNEEIKRQNNEKLKMVKKQQEAEIKALELEINSHFIYNTLNAINYTAVSNEDFETSDLLKVFANVLRYMTQRRDALVTVCQEIEWLTQYLFLQKSRFDNRFDFEVDVDPAIEMCRLRKLLLQPFVENSIIHGFNCGKKQGMITIICSAGKDGRIRISISDDGEGIPEEILKKIQQGIFLEDGPDNLGLGMANTCYRMCLYYGSGFYFDIQSHPGEGTQVILEIPAL